MGGGLAEVGQMGGPAHLDVRDNESRIGARRGDSKHAPAVATPVGAVAQEQSSCPHSCHRAQQHDQGCAQAMPPLRAAGHLRAHTNVTWAAHAGGGRPVQVTWVPWRCG
jgi:hypothetical protein